MVYRKGELSSVAIDREWPHQVALPADQCSGKNWLIHHAFCKGLDLSLCNRGHFFYRDGVGHNVFCFAKHEDAATFLAHFGGELLDPKNRPRWPR